ncbi:MAG: GYF domain-containing protein [Pirellulaceae bacterium]|nr:GYF domain-containing protein [Pirellulaceae bacterium]
MNIACPHCQQVIGIPPDSGGQQLRCPQCNGVFIAPFSEEEPSTFSPSETGSSGVDSSAQYHVKGVDGNVYGPADFATLEQWVKEGRITADNQICVVGTDNWQGASTLFLQLRTQTPSTKSTNPFSTPSAATSQTSPFSGKSFRSHNGGVILTFGILSFCCCPFGLAALIWGLSDLEKMKRGEMDPSGHGLTMAGTICGGIGVVLNLFGSGLQLALGL